MSWSSIKRLTNEMTNFEEESTTTIAPESYYVIRVTIGTSKGVEDAQRIAEKELKDSSSAPLAVYCNHNEFILVFPCAIEDKPHYLEGNYQRIVSAYAAKFAANHHTKDVNIKIVAFKTQMQVITYIGWIVLQTTHDALKRHSNGKITDSALNFRTITELIPVITEMGVDWEKLSSPEKYGILVRQRRSTKNAHSKHSGSSKNVDYICEQFDARESKKYINFVFS